MWSWTIWVKSTGIISKQTHFTWPVSIYTGMYLCMLESLSTWINLNRMLLIYSFWNYTYIRNSYLSCFGDYIVFGRCKCMCLENRSVITFHSMPCNVVTYQYTKVLISFNTYFIVWDLSIPLLTTNKRTNDLCITYKELGRIGADNRSLTTCLATHRTCQWWI